MRKRNPFFRRHFDTAKSSGPNTGVQGKRPESVGVQGVGAAQRGVTDPWAASEVRNAERASKLVVAPACCLWAPNLSLLKKDASGLLSLLHIGTPRLTRGLCRTKCIDLYANTIIENLNILHISRHKNHRFPSKSSPPFQLPSSPSDSRLSKSGTGFVAGSGAHGATVINRDSNEAFLGD